MKEPLTLDELRSFRDYVNTKRKVKRKPDRFGNPVRFLLSHEEAFALWLSSGQINNRGTSKGQYSLCREDDFGDYLPGKCVIELTTKNSREGKLGRPSSIKGRVSPTAGMSMPTQKCPHCAGIFPNSASRHHVGASCIMKGHRDGHSGSDHPS